jgi:ribA/ribD-fused uncharacterized protein
VWDETFYFDGGRQSDFHDGAIIHIKLKAYQLYAKQSDPLGDIRISVRDTGAVEVANVGHWAQRTLIPVKVAGMNEEPTGHLEVAFKYTPVDTAEPPPTLNDVIKASETRVRGTSQGSKWLPKQVQNLGTLPKLSRESPLAPTDLVRFDTLAVAAAASEIEESRAPGMMARLAARMYDVEHGITPGNRVHHIHTYANCFKVSEALTWAEKDRICASHKEAHALLEHMRQLDYLVVVKQDFHISKMAKAVGGSVVAVPSSAVAMAVGAAESLLPSSGEKGEKEGKRNSISDKTAALLAAVEKVEKASTKTSVQVPEGGYDISPAVAATATAVAMVGETKGESLPVEGTITNGGMGAVPSWSKSPAFLAKTAGALPMQGFQFFVTQRSDCFSQWYARKRGAPAPTTNAQAFNKVLFSMWSEQDKDVRRYYSAEQYLQASKAARFGDEKRRKKIMDTKDSLQAHKEGGNLKGYDEEEWHRECRSFSLRANIAKFMQNGDLRRELLGTGSRILAETDSENVFMSKAKSLVWGTGLGMTSKNGPHPHLWPGHNLLGVVLMQVRHALQSPVAVLCRALSVRLFLMHILKLDAPLSKYGTEAATTSSLQQNSAMQEGFLDDSDGDSDEYGHASGDDAEGTAAAGHGNARTHVEWASRRNRVPEDLGVDIQNLSLGVDSQAVQDLVEAVRQAVEQLGDLVKRSCNQQADATSNSSANVPEAPPIVREGSKSNSALTRSMSVDMREQHPLKSVLNKFCVVFRSLYGASVENAPSPRHDDGDASGGQLRELLRFAPTDFAEISEVVTHILLETSPLLQELREVVFAAVQDVMLAQLRKEVWAVVRVICHDSDVRADAVARDLLDQFSQRFPATPRVLCRRWRARVQVCSGTTTLKGSSAQALNWPDFLLPEEPSPSDAACRIERGSSFNVPIDMDGGLDSLARASIERVDVAAVGSESLPEDHDAAEVDLCVEMVWLMTQAVAPKKKRAFLRRIVSSLQRYATSCHVDCDNLDSGEDRNPISSTKELMVPLLAFVFLKASMVKERSGSGGPPSSSPDYRLHLLSQLVVMRDFVPPTFTVHSCSVSLPVCLCARSA